MVMKMVLVAMVVVEGDLVVARGGPRGVQQARPLVEEEEHLQGHVRGGQWRWRSTWSFSLSFWGPNCRAPM